MTGLDTNVLVRFFAQDDRAQSDKAEELLQTLSPESQGFLSVVSLVELIWVLRSHYRMSKSRLVVCIERLLDAPELTIESQPAVAQALKRFASGKGNFADLLIERLGKSAGCHETVTFDLNAAQFAGMRLL